MLGQFTQSSLQMSDRIFDAFSDCRFVFIANECDLGVRCSCSTRTQQIADFKIIEFSKRIRRGFVLTLLQTVCNISSQVFPVARLGVIAPSETIKLFYHIFIGHWPFDARQFAAVPKLPIQTPGRVAHIDGNALPTRGFDYVGLSFERVYKLLRALRRVERFNRIANYRLFGVNCSRLVVNCFEGLDYLFSIGRGLRHGSENLASTLGDVNA